MIALVLSFIMGVLAGVAGVMIIIVAIADKDNSNDELHK